MEIDGTTIFYLEKNKQASCTLFFIHGNSCSSHLWRKQYLSELFSDYRLVVFDLPGHGKSDLLPVELYSLTGLGEIIAKAVTRLADNKPFFLVGLSLGTNVVCNMLFENITPIGVVMAGASILGGDYKAGNFVYKNTPVHVVFKDEVAKQDVAAYAAETAASSDPLVKELLLRNHLNVGKPIIQLIEKMNRQDAASEPKVILKKSYYLNEGGKLFSKREKEVLLWMAEGLTSKEIGDKLFISEGTVIVHRKNMLSKSRCSNANALIAFAIRNQII